MIRAAPPGCCVSRATNGGELARFDYVDLLPSAPPVNRAPTAVSLAAGPIAENAAGATIGTLTVVDPDAGDTHGFSVDDARFEVAGNVLRLKVGESLDFEAASSIDVTVTATDQGGLSTQQLFTIAVANANEGPTAIALAAAPVLENVAGAVVGTLSATDPDAGAALTFTVNDGRFEVVGTTLRLKAGQALDFEAASSIDLTVTATDQGGLSTQQLFTIAVANANEAPTAIALAATQVGENAAGALFGAVTVVDPDAGDSVAFTVDDARFEVVGGVLRLKAGEALDFEAAAAISVAVTATDAGGLSLRQGFTITVLNVNEAPAFTAGPTAVSVAENTLAVADYDAADPDAGATLVFGIAGGADATRFTIDASTGALSFIAAPNFEAPADAGANNI